MHYSVFKACNAVLNLIGQRNLAANSRMVDFGENYYTTYVLEVKSKRVKSGLSAREAESNKGFFV